MASDAAADRDDWADVVAFPGERRVLGLRDVIGDVLREERHRQDRTLADVADEAAVSLPYLSEVERGRKEVSSDLLRAVHEALGLELDEVLDRAARRLRPGSERSGDLRMLAA
ncbi:helix-turn-helix domain-containing protein [Actinospongicola halichondriae]|uniref:helix-turn-helix domain-containing protein n=1 Tax=Actinospongicola halichondriae TaxID=3236844 RepID=UPI003D4E215C